MRKVIIRSGVFECNSSSSHSISIADETKEFVIDPIYPDENGVVTLTGGEYGWDYFKYGNSLDKANYVAQQFSYDNMSLELLSDVIKRMTGAVDVVFSNLDEGYIDHDSVGIIPVNREDLRNLIFNKNSWIFGGNDNSEPDPMFYDVPEFKQNCRIDPKYKYELSIVSLEYKMSTKFKQYPTEDEIGSAINTLVRDYKYVGNDIYVKDTLFGRLTSNNDYFNLGYRGNNINFDDCTIRFTKDGFRRAKAIYDLSPESKTLDWGREGYRKVREIEESLYNDPESGLVSYGKYIIKEI